MLSENRFLDTFRGHNIRPVQSKIKILKYYQLYNNYLYARFFKEIDTDIARERCLEKSKENESNGEPRQTASVARHKISCPMLSCKAKVIHLPRHMRNVHNWTKEAAAKVLWKYNSSYVLALHHLLIRF